MNIAKAPAEPEELYSHPAEKLVSPKKQILQSICPGMNDANHNLFAIFFIEVLVLLLTAAVHRILEDWRRNSNEFEYSIFYLWAKKQSSKKPDLDIAISSQHLH